MTRKTPQGEPRLTEADLLEAAWGIIANAGNDAWSGKIRDWLPTAERWRDEYFAWKKSRK